MPCHPLEEVETQAGKVLPSSCDDPEHRIKKHAPGLITLPQNVTHRVRKETLSKPELTQDLGSIEARRE